MVSINEPVLRTSKVENISKSQNHYLCLVYPTGSSEVRLTSEAQWNLKSKESIWINIISILYVYTVWYLKVKWAPMLTLSWAKTSVVSWHRLCRQATAVDCSSGIHHVLEGTAERDRLESRNISSPPVPELTTLFTKGITTYKRP